MADWQPVVSWVWEYAVPPYHGVLASIYRDAEGGTRRFTAQILPPRDRYCTPQVFTTLADASAWIEQELERLRVDNPAGGVTD
jgi:hypothetical protein